MPVPPELVNSLYQPKPAEAGKSAQIKQYKKFSNMDLLHLLAKDPIQMAAGVFMRPKMAMRYNLLPALASLLDYQRPYGNARAVVPKTPEENFARSLSLLLDLADPNWRELPPQWCYLGSFLDSHDREAAREAIDDIFASTNVPKPMEFMRGFCSPRADSTDWKRYFWLTEDELKEFHAEKKETIDRILADTEEKGE